ncbi:MAG: thiamine pyrophosphate-binding protein [Bryobacteraceae bacterium]
MKRTAVEWLVDGLRRRGVEWMAALCGHGLDPLFDAAERAGIRLIDTRNEQTAAYIAEYYGRLTGKPGVCATSSGVAVANALTGVVNAWFDQAPMLYFSGSANLPTLGLGGFQDMDHAEFVKPVARYSKFVDVPERIVHMLDEAWRAAKSSPQGPAHLMLPLDIQKTEVAECDLVLPNAGGAPVGPNLQAVDAIARALLEARKPLILASSPVFYSGQGQDLVALAEALSIPVQTPIWDRGVFDSSSEAFLGVIGAATGGPALLEECDCLILAGVPSDYRVGYLQRAGVATHRLVRGWRQLRERASDLGVEAKSEWLTTARTKRDLHTARVRDMAAKQAVPGQTHAIDLVTAIGEALPAEGTLVIDGGSIGQWAHQLLCERRYPSHWLTCGRSGVVGYGLGGAMAARLAFPGKPVVLLSGDGAFTFTVAEIECAVRQKLPFVAIVADDRCWGITHSGHLKQFGHGIGTELGPIRFDLLAQSLGAEGRVVTDRAALVPEIRRAIASGTVTLLHVPIVGGNPA